ncbi:hypothetical protein HHI36_012348 [Cryptolaemus montrouzieri]|uniref:Uncharacterized protein n=1 Tax=Cryptolaemus montrouzieri TaxID=559131 RepID=A0ABD2NDZ1_9CUCU
MNDSVGYIFISQYSFMTIMLALFEYQLIKTGNIVLLMRFSGWLLMQIAICSSGQYLINESLQIRDAVYNMPWYDMPSELRRTFEVFLASVQKPMSLVAKPIVVLNNEYLLSVVKSSYSIMMFLQTWSSIEIE